MKLSIVSALFTVMACMTHTGHAKALTLIIDNKEINAEIADTSEKLTTGLSNRSNIEKNSGMLFVFPYKTTHCMTMSKTNIPLSVVFLTDDFKISEVIKMQPYSNKKYCASNSIQYALEIESSLLTHNDLQKQIIIKEDIKNEK